MTPWDAKSVQQYITYNDNDNDNEFLFRRMNRKKK